MSITHDAAVEHLRRVDPTLARLIERVGPCRLEARAEGTHFDAVVRAIVYQQLSGKAASTILGRVLAMYGNRYPTPRELLDTSDEKLRSVGLSRQKIGYLRDLSGRALSNALPVDTLHELDDDQLLAALTGVKGVGRWTAQMFMMFRLGRPNVLPDQDLGVRKAIQHTYRLRALPDGKRIARIGKTWHPYCSVASWYLWRSLELEDAPGPARRTNTRPRAGSVSRPRTSTRRAGKAKSLSRAKAPTRVKRSVAKVKVRQARRSAGQAAARKRATRSRTSR
jgi:DNA-3-methyladenine glycosylase II